MEEFKKIWNKLNKGGEATEEEAKKGKKFIGILALALLALLILVVVIGGDSLLSLLAIPVGFLLYVAFVQFSRANRIIEQYEKSVCKVCKAHLAFDENATFKIIGEWENKTAEKTGYEDTGNWIATREGNGYKVTKEQKAKYESKIKSRGVKVEYNCKCPDCNTANIGTLEIECYNSSDEFIERYLKDYFANPQKSRK